MIKGVHDIETMLGLDDVGRKTRENAKGGISEPNLKKRGEGIMSKNKNIETMCVHLDNLKGHVCPGGQHC